MGLSDLPSVLSFHMYVRCVCARAHTTLYVNTWRDTQTCGDVCGGSGLKLGVFFNHLSTLYIEVQFRKPGTHLSSQSS